MKKEQVYKMPFSKIYPMYVQKAEKKNRTKEEVDALVFWLTGYDGDGLRRQIEKEVDLEKFFAEAPQINPESEKITGTICGIRIEEIEDSLMQKIRRLDKLIDDLAKGKPIEKIIKN